MPETIEAVVKPAAAYYIERVKRKLATGVYPTEAVACFCGEPHGQTVVETDRYGFEHRMVVCPRCGLLRATPRMTAEAYRQFYEQEYRQIYDDQDGEGNDTENFDAGVARSRVVQAKLRDYDCQPRVVFELGCNAGAWLVPYLETGAECLGVDWGPARIAYGQQQGLPVVRGGLETLEQYGKPADLILLSHVIEHLTDLEGTVRRLRALLTEHGMLVVRCPSLLTWHFDVLFQNAHTWQFTAGTLQYVMECCGFEDCYLDEQITSFWRRSDEIRKKTSIDREEVYRIHRFLGGDKQLIPTIKTVNKFPLTQRKANLKYALATGYPDIRDLRITNPAAGRPAIVLGGGPSVDLHVEHLEALRAEGASVFAIERMLPWCLAHGFVPDYVVTMDASDDVIEAFHSLPSTTAYLTAVQCQPAIFDRLRGLSVYLFNTPQKGISLADFWDDANRDVVTQVNAGGSVVICTLSLAMTLGARAIHLFGFDCHVTDGSYAQGIAGVGEQRHVYEIRIDGVERIYRTTSPYLSFAQQFFKLLKMAKDQQLLDTIQVYGDSLVKHMAKPGTVISFEHRPDSILLRTV